MQNFVLNADAPAEAPDAWSFNTTDFAHACGVTVDWVQARVNDGVIAVSTTTVNTDWRFDSTSVVRARRIVHLELTYEADPQLAALTTDLIEEVARLRLQLREVVW